MSLATQRLARLINRLLLAITRHWLALANGAMALLLGGAYLAPWLMLRGQTRLGQLLYRVYGPLCHQLPERSFFIGGPQPWYSFEQLSLHLGYDAPARYIGNAQLGYKAAFCERDVAIYIGFLLAGLVFALFRRRIKPLPWPLLLAAMAPMAIDGTVQLVGLAESTWLRRSVTGLLFGAGVIWFAFPLLEQGMKEAYDIARRIEEGGDAGDR